MQIYWSVSYNAWQVPPCWQGKLSQGLWKYIVRKENIRAKNLLNIDRLIVIGRSNRGRRICLIVWKRNWYGFGQKIHLSFIYFFLYCRLNTRTIRQKKWHDKWHDYYFQNRIQSRCQAKTTWPSSNIKTTIVIKATPGLSKVHEYSYVQNSNNDCVIHLNNNYDYNWQNLKKQKMTKRIEIYQLQLTDEYDFLWF